MFDQESRGHSIEKDLKQGEKSAYIGSLIRSRPERDFPVWEFVEVISFGRFVHFFRFCANRFGGKKMTGYFYMLQSVKALKNACAHNSCILNDLKGGTAQRAVSYDVARALSKIGIGDEVRKTKLSNERLGQIATTLYLHQLICSSGGNIP